MGNDQAAEMKYVRRVTKKYRLKHEQITHDLGVYPILKYIEETVK